MRQVLGPGALGRPRGIGWRGRWEGGSGWGIHVTPWLIHVNVWQKPLQYCKVISLQLIKINEKKKDACRVPQITWLIQELTSGLLAPQQWFSYHTLSFQTPYKLLVFVLVMKIITHYPLVQWFLPAVQEFILLKVHQKFKEVRSHVNFFHLKKYSNDKCLL